MGSRRLRLFSLLVNSFLLLVSVEFAAEGYLHDAPDAVFTRLGAIYPDRAKIAIRYPDYKDPIHVVWRRVSQASDPQAQPWTLGLPITLSESADWVNSTTISPLWPNTMYECNLFTPLFDSLFLTFNQIRWRVRINNYCPTHRAQSSLKPSPIPCCQIPPHSASSCLPA